VPRKREPDGTDEPKGPEKLVRESAGRYRTADGRFGVSGEPGGSWYLADAEQANEFGLPRLIGPYPTLDRVREVIGQMRAGIEVEAPAGPAPTGGKPQLTVIPGGAGQPADILPPKPGQGRAPSAGRAPAERPRPPSPPTWLERLEPKERTRATKLIRALERLDMPDAEGIARADLKSGLPQAARAVLVRMVWQELVDGWGRDPAAVHDAAAALGRQKAFAGAEMAVRRLLDGEPEGEDLPLVVRVVALRTAARLFEILARGRAARGNSGRDLPGWRLVELDAEGEPTDRALQLSEDDVLRLAPAPGDEQGTNERE
jgi:hypothetical protein